MSYIQNFFTSRDNNANAETYVGQVGRLWWDPTTNQIYYSDGSTPGGIALSGGGGLPSQTGNSGKFLQTNGVVPSWQYVAGVFGLTIDGGTAYNVSECLVVDGGGA